MKKKIVFIMNPISGTASKASIPNLIDSILDKDRFEYEIRTTERAGHASEIASEAKEAHVDIVVAVGGDGTVNEVARAIVHSDTALGILPCGSGNGLARHLMLPMNLKKSIEIINQCEIHDLDYGVINGYPFFCTCGMGFDAFVSMKFAESGKRGPISYAENILREGLKYQPGRDGNKAIQGLPHLVCQRIAIWQQRLYRSTGIDERRTDGRGHHGAFRCTGGSAGKFRYVQQDARQALQD